MKEKGHLMNLMLSLHLFIPTTFLLTLLLAPLSNTEIPTVLAPSIAMHCALQYTIYLRSDKKIVNDSFSAITCVALRTDPQLENIAVQPTIHLILTT